MSEASPAEIELLRVLREAGGEPVGIGDLLLALEIDREELYRRIEALRERG